MSKVNELKYAKDAQNKLEMALSLKESGKEDEIVIDRGNLALVKVLFEEKILKEF